LFHASQIAVHDPCTKDRLCGGAPYGEPNTTNCCVPAANGTWLVEQSGIWANGTVFDYDKMDCDPSCGLIPESQRCCSGKAFDTTTHFCW